MFDYADGQLIRRVDVSNAKAGESAGYRMAKGYFCIRVDGVQLLRHRLVWIWHYGADPGCTLDHVNNVKGDDRIENLQQLSHRDNVLKSCERRDLPPNVHHSGRSNKPYVGKFWYQGRSFEAGRHRTVEEAVAAVEAKRREVEA